MAAVDRHALLVVSNRNGPRAVARLATLAVIMVWGGLVLGVALGLTFAIVEVAPDAPTWLIYLPVAILCIPIVAVGATPGLLRAAMTAGAQNTAIRELCEASREPVWVLGQLAAWPQGEGHAGRLLLALAAAEHAGVAVAVARTPELVRTYQRRGLIPYPNSSEVLYLPHNSSCSGRGQQLS